MSQPRSPDMVAAELIVLYTQVCLQHQAGKPITHPLHHALLQRIGVLRPHLLVHPYFQRQNTGATTRPTNPSAMGMIILLVAFHRASLRHGTSLLNLDATHARLRVQTLGFPFFDVRLDVGGSWREDEGYAE